MCVYRITDFFFTQHFGIFLALSILMCGDVHLNPDPIYSDTLRVSHLNIRSLISLSSVGTHPADQRYIKMDEIYLKQVPKFKTQIITLSETWLDKSVPDSDIILEGYTIFRHDRNRAGGGVAIYVTENLPVHRVLR